MFGYETTRKRDRRLIYLGAAWGVTCWVLAGRYWSRQADRGE